MIYIDPVTRQRVTYQPDSGDFQYSRVGGSAISTQVIPILGPSAQQQMNQGRSNALFGTDEALQGKTLPDLGITGENIQTTNRHRITRRVDPNRNN